MEEREFFKYNEDDILEILTEFLAKKSGYGSFNSKAIFLGTPSKDLRLITVIGSLEDREICKMDIESLDATLAYNGTHNKNYYSDSEILKNALDDVISKGDF